MIQISDEEYIQSALTELINIGGGNAATSLSKLIDQPIKMELPTLEMMEYEEVFHSIQSEETPVKVVLIRLIGGKGSFIFVTEPEYSCELAKMMFPEDTEISEELIDSAVTELGNVLVNSFLNATMRLLNTSIISAVPLMVEDMFGSILTSLYMEQNNFDSQIVIVRNEFWSMGEKIEGSLYFIPNPETIDQLTEEIMKQKKETE